MSSNLNLTLKVWRQGDASEKGAFETYQLSDVSPDSSFLEMLDQLNEQLIQEGKMPVTFEHDCREGICGSCGFMINGQAHGLSAVRPSVSSTCAVLSRARPWSLSPGGRKLFPVLRDLLVDRSPLTGSSKPVGTARPT